MLRVGNMNIKTKDNSVFFIRLRIDNAFCWHYIKVPKTKLELLKNLKEDSEIDVAKLGNMLESGYGYFPSDEIIKKYGVEV